MSELRDANLARAIVEHVGAKPLSVREIVGQGAVNYVFVLETSDGDWVVRFNRDPLDQDDYLKEAWCLKKVRTHGIPVPEVIATGVLQDIPFIIQTFVEGMQADSCLEYFGPLFPHD